MGEQMKQTIIHILKITLFLCCCFFAYCGLKRYFVVKDPGMYFQFASFYEQEDNTVDVVCIGSSRVFCDISPATFWKEQGIAAYDLATSSQTIANSYYTFKEVLKTQTPKVAVFEVSQWYAGVTEGGDLQNMAILSGMKNSLNRMDVLKTSVTPEERIDSFLVFPYFHTRYSELTQEDFTAFDYMQYPQSKASGFKGFAEYFHAVPQEEFPTEPKVRTESLTEETKEYIEKIFALAEEADCQVLFVHTPSLRCWEYQEVHEIADAHGIQYLNYNLLMDEIQFDTATDFIDDGHLNRYGAWKLTSHLAQYISQNYDIENHKDDSRYLSWDENLAYSEQCEMNARLKKETGMGNYFSFFPNPNYTVIVSLIGDYNREDVGQQGALLSCGINEAAYQLGGTCVFDKSGVLYYSKIAEQKGWKAIINDSTFVIKEDDAGVLSEILIDGKNYLWKEQSERRIENGIDVIVYDNLSHKVIDSVAFCADNAYGIIR